MKRTNRMSCYLFLTSQEAEFERDVLLRSVCDTVVPKLVAEDLPLLQSLLSSVFTGASVKQIEALQLRAMLKEVCQAHNLRPTDSFIEKALQLYQVQEIRHGVMLVGPSGSGKSSISSLSVGSYGAIGWPARKYLHN